MKTEAVRTGRRRALGTLLTGLGLLGLRAPAWAGGQVEEPLADAVRAFELAGDRARAMKVQLVF